MPKVTRNNRLLDVRPDRVDLRDRAYRPPLVSLPDAYPDPEEIPKLLPVYESLILDQGDEGACTGFGLAAVVNYLFWRRARDAAPSGPVPRPRVVVSARMLYHLARMYDEWPGENYEGSSCRGAMKGWHRHGVCLDSLWPHRDKAGRVRSFLKPKKGWDADAATRTLGSYYRVSVDSVADLQAAIREVGAVYASASVHGGWFLDPSETLPVIEQTGEVDGGHAFALVGYATAGFIVQNSWGPEWGYHGFALLPYEDWVANGMDAWVAVLGVPVDAARASATSRRSVSLRAAAEQRTEWSFLRRHEATPDLPASVHPWSEATAYGHTVVLGNDGAPLNRLVDTRDAEDAVDEVSLRRVRDWLDRRSEGDRRIVVYAHGGLNDEDSSLKRVRVLAPYFAANGVYPLFVTWRTGFRESVVDLVEDGLRRSVFTRRAEGLGDWLEQKWDDLKERAAAARDRTVEIVCENLLVKAVWSQMKQNARTAHEAGSGGAQLGDNLVRLLRDLDGTALHLVGHSAGGIYLGHLLSHLRQEAAPVRTLTLLAPACSVAFANTHYLPALADGMLDRRRFAVENLSDPRERADSVGPYGKSLLYLVSRALETRHKTPLLGLANAWDPDLATGADDAWHRATRPGLATWIEGAGDLRPRLVDTEFVNDGESDIPASHGSFDNNVEVMTRTLGRILDGREPEVPILSLRGF